MKKLLPIALLIVIAILVLMILCGCAGYKVNRDGSVDSYGVLRTLTDKKVYYESGILKEHTISTESTTKDVLLGLNTIVDSAVNTAAKLKP